MGNLLRFGSYIFSLFILSSLVSFALIDGVVPENIHTPPPPHQGRHFCFKPPHPGISIPRGACHNPHPWNFRNFSLGWVPSGKNICLENVRERYLFCDKMKINNFICVSTVSNNLKDVLS